MTEIVRYGLRLTVAGMGIVFLVLAFIATVVTVIRVLDRIRIKKQSRSLSQESSLTKTQTIDDTTLVLISAAVATILKGRHRIRRIRKVVPVSSSGSPWSMQGRATLLGSHVLPKQSEKSY
jgi:Na+-transporting methylmalonyl-CoA/oxaloacetate decarboxylase gamma subunit